MPMADVETKTCRPSCSAGHIKEKFSGDRPSRAGTPGETQGFKAAHAGTQTLDKMATAGARLRKGRSRHGRDSAEQEAVTNPPPFARTLNGGSIRRPYPGSPLGRPRMLHRPASDFAPPPRRGGPGSKAYMQEVVRVAHRLSARVEFLGGRRNAARNAFYGEIDLFVMPSRFKPFGSTLLEAVWH